MRPLRALLLSLLVFAAAPLPAADEADRRPVTTIQLEHAATRVERTAPAEVRALARTAVSARLAAEVQSLAVEIGDRVETGQTLARLDCTDYRDALDQAEATLAEREARLRLAGIRLERSRRLREQNAVSADELDEAEAERAALSAGVRAQRTRVATARRDVARCSVAAPYAGLVVARPGEPGAFVQPGTPLVELVATDRIELRARLTETDAATLRTAGSAWFRANGQRHAVEPIGIVGAADTDSRTREARLGFVDAPPIPGTAGRLHWVAHPRAIPADLLVRRDGRLGVLTVESGTVRFRALPEAVEGRPAPTRLPGDTRLVVDGRYGVTDGQAVRVVE